MVDSIIKPDPDPTILTTEALHREVTVLEQLIGRRFEVLSDRLDATERNISDKIKLRDETIEVKFNSIETQFAGRDKATEQLEAVNKTALTAALQTQEKAAGASFESLTAAINKTEAGFTKAIDGIGDKISAISTSFDDKINDLKSRLDRGDGRFNGTTEQKTDTRYQQTATSQNVGMIIGIISTVGMFLSLIIAAIAIARTMH